MRIHPPAPHAARYDSGLLDQYLAGMAAGNKESLAELYHTVSPAVYSFALSLLKNRQDAEDILHDVFISLYASAGSYRSSGKPMAWIMTIVRNHCLKMLRERRHTPEELEAVWDVSALETLPSEEKLLVRECLFRLTDEERQIVVLHAVSGFRHREIAQFMSLPLSTVLSKYRRAIKKLDRDLREE